ncbi:unnamed protein product [Brachionus calyciflorus]|uniref:Ig-like domain-containing protein n=1 Tax=Brachionus calyciflorus TaxID=104777 RepID=A0A813ZRW0_9BILA|nr:unnamed protein product [Brachionus calyciflorus]
MKQIILLVITTLLVKCIYCQQNTEVYNLPTAAGLRLNDARGPEFLKYNLNLVIGLNSSLTLTTLNQSNAVYWVLSQYTNETFLLEQENKLTQNIRLPLFNVLKPNVRNSTIRSQFMCSPSEQECNQMTIPKFGLNYLGTYSYQAQIDNVMDSIFVDFNISTFINHVDLACNSGDCLYNQSSQQLSILSGKKISLECSVLIGQNNLYTPAAELNILSDRYEDCFGETQINQIDPTEVYTYLNMSSNVNIVLYKLSKKCEKTFYKNDLGKTFTCELKSKNQSVPVELNRIGVLDSLISKLDVQYEPEMKLSSNQQLNKTLIAGQGVTAFFSCPFESNPSPQFEWRVKNVIYNSTDLANTKRLALAVNDFSRAEKEFPIPKDLEIGFYQFECRAKVDGLVNKYSQIVTFNLNIIAPPVAAKKDSKTNVGAIIGGVIGGVIALVVVVLLVLLFIRRSRNNGSKDEIEKAKDNNPSDNSKHARNNSLNVVDENRQFGEASSLAANKVGQQSSVSLSSSSSSEAALNNELPVLELKTSGEISPKRASELTSSATDFVNSNSNINATSYRVIPGMSSSGLYSPSTAEARANDAAAKDANISHASKLIRKQQDELGSSSLGSVTGGIKVLPSPKPFLKISQSFYFNLFLNLNLTRLDMDINDGNPHLSSRTSLTTNNSSKQSQSNGTTNGQKVIPGLMVPSTAAQSYAAIAHAAAAAANQQRNQFGGNQIDFSSSGSSQNLAKSYNNPGFFETGSFNNQNPLESPPPYDSALHQPAKNQQQTNQLLQQQQQQHKEYMGSNTRLIPGSNTPQMQKNFGPSLSYTATPQQNLMNSTPNGLGNSMQHLQYTTVQNLARNRNPLNGMNDQMDAQATQYTTMAQLNPIDV